MTYDLRFNDKLLRIENRISGVLSKDDLQKSTVEAVALQREHGVYTAIERRYGRQLYQAFADGHRTGNGALAKVHRLLQHRSGLRPRCPGRILSARGRFRLAVSDCDLSGECDSGKTSNRVGIETIEPGARFSDQPNKIQSINANHQSQLQFGCLDAP